MRFNIISSGSKGNTSVVIYKKTAILIDMGVSFSCMEAGLEEKGIKPEDLSAAIFTHNHSDHIAGIRFLSPKIMYALEGTLPGTLSNIIELNKEFQIGDISVTAFKTSHDAVNPCGFLLKGGNETLVYMTDTGYVHQAIYEEISNAEAYILESNHDPEILMHSERPYMLKIRILGDHGHMSNEDSMITLCNVMGNKTKLVLHAHISQECNLTEIINLTREMVFNDYGIDASNVEFVILKPYFSGDYEI